jgi:hypothetical protein
LSPEKRKSVSKRNQFEREEPSLDERAIEEKEAVSEVEDPVLKRAISLQENDQVSKRKDHAQKRGVSKRGLQYLSEDQGPKRMLRYPTQGGR